MKLTITIPGVAVAFGTDSWQAINISVQRFEIWDRLTSSTTIRNENKCMIYPSTSVALLWYEAVWVHTVDSYEMKL